MRRGTRLVRLHLEPRERARCARTDRLIPPANELPFGAADPYQACVAAVDANAADAFEMASIWRDHGGGAPAEHCIALALIALDEPGEAASRLDLLARRLDTGAAADRARLLAQSGNAWLLASELQNAEAAFSAALKLTPRDAEIWTDRARTRAARPPGRATTRPRGNRARTRR